MKIFVIHSGADYKAVEEQMENIRGGSTDVEFLMPEHGRNARTGGKSGCTSAN